MKAQRGTICGPRLRAVVIGAGRMARLRAAALSRVGGVEWVGVAARRRERAARFATELSRVAGMGQSVAAFDDFRQLAGLRPDFVLIETPHRVGEIATRWALENGLHCFVGGPLACSAVEARWVADYSSQQGIVVEAGYEARYKRVWLRSGDILASGGVGDVVAAQSLALFPAEPGSWYYRQGESGGMPLTHMTYAFLNPLRMLLGTPRVCAALANRKLHAFPGGISEETCVALLQFPGQVPCSMTAGYVRPAGGQEDDTWWVRIHGTAGRLEIFPSDTGAGALLWTRDGESREESFGGDAPLDSQARAFVAELGGRSCLRNRPDDAVEDVILAEAIARAAGIGGELPWPAEAGIR